MTRYYKLLEEGKIAVHMHFYDRFGDELLNVIELDPEQDDGFPNGKRLNPDTGLVENCYYVPCTVEVDGVINPPQDQLMAFRIMHKSKHFSLLPQEERHTIIRQMRSLAATEENTKE